MPIKNSEGKLKYNVHIKAGTAESARANWVRYVMKDGDFVYIGQHPLYSMSTLSRNRSILRCTPLESCITNGFIAVSHYMKTITNIRMVLIHLFNMYYRFHSNKILSRYPINGFMLLDFLSLLGLGSCIWRVRWNYREDKLESIHTQYKYTGELAILIVDNNYQHSFKHVMDIDGMRVITNLIILPTWPEPLAKSYGIFSKEQWTTLIGYSNDDVIIYDHDVNNFAFLPLWEGKVGDGICGDFDFWFTLRHLYFSMDYEYKQLVLFLDKYVKYSEQESEWPGTPLNFQFNRLPLFLLMNSVFNFVINRRLCYVWKFKIITFSYGYIREDLLVETILRLGLHVSSITYHH